MILSREEIHFQVEEVLIPFAANGDKDAEAYLKRLFYIVRKLDDVWDQDEPVSREEIAKGFFLALVDIPLNPFFQAHQNTLVGAQIIAFNAWQDANEMETSSEDLKRIYAHVLRDYVCEFFPLVAYLTGGQAHMRKVSPLVRKVFEKPLGA